MCVCVCVYLCVCVCQRKIEEEKRGKIEESKNGEERRKMGIIFVKSKCYSKVYRNAAMHYKC